MPPASRWTTRAIRIFSCTRNIMPGRANTFKMPEDHHELLAMVAPRALLVSGNTDFYWLSNHSNYVNSLAAQQIYENFGIGDRFGFYIDGGHGHCAVPATQQPSIDA